MVQYDGPEFRRLAQGASNRMILTVTQAEG